MSTFEDLAKSIDAFERKNYAVAEQLAREVLRANPYLPYPYRILQSCNEKTHQSANDPKLFGEIHDYLPAYGDVLARLATDLLQRGEIAAATSMFDRALNLPFSFNETRMLPYGTVSKARLKHDYQHVLFLCERGILDTNFYASSLGALERLVENFDVNQQTMRLDNEQLINISAIYRRCLHIHDSPIPACIVDQENLERALRSFLIRDETSRFVWFDNFFTPEGYRSLRDYLLLSSIWHNDAQKGSGYLGAYQFNGLRHPLVERLISQVEEVFSLLMAKPSLEQIWCYKNVIGSSGVGVHADFSQINLNVWLTPSVFNRDHETGGLIYYQARAPSDWPFEKYNGNDREIELAILNSEKIIVPYCENRAMIFDSALFHGSNGVHFDECYEGQRINMTFLYGERSSDSGTQAS